MKLRDNILYHNNRKCYIKEEIGTGFFIENGVYLHSQFKWMVCLMMMNLLQITLTISICR